MQFLPIVTGIITTDNFSRMNVSFHDYSWTCNVFFFDVTEIFSSVNFSLLLMTVCILRVSTMLVCI